MDAGLHGALLPARLADAGQLAFEGHVPERDSRDAELAVITARSTRNRAAALQARGARIAREFREGCLDFELLFDRNIGIVQALAQRGALLSVLLDQLLALAFLLPL